MSENDGLPVKKKIKSIFCDDDFDMLLYTPAAGEHVKGLNEFLKQEGDFTYWLQKEAIAPDGCTMGFYNIAKNPFTGFAARLDTPFNWKQHLALLRRDLYFPDFDAALEEYPFDGMDGIAIRLPKGITCIDIDAPAHSPAEYADADRRAMEFIKRIDAYAERNQQDGLAGCGTVRLFVRADWKKIMRRLDLYDIPARGLYFSFYPSDRPAVTVSGMMLHDGDLSFDRTNKIIDALTEYAERKENV